MRAVGFQVEVRPDRTLSVPAEVAGGLPHGQPLRFPVLIPEGDGDRDWEELAAIDFGQGYADSDAIYDQLSGR